MAKTTATAGPPIEKLLEERARLQHWLAKLDATSGTAPPGVREKVRADYLGRLRAVIDELRSHATTIQTELERQRRLRAELEARRLEAEETLAEARVRHAVGEYTDEEWQRLSQENARNLEQVQGELSHIAEEMARLVEVQELITETKAAPVRADAARPAPPIEMLPDPTPDIAAAVGSPPSLEPPPEQPSPSTVPSAPRFVPRPAAEPARARPAAAGSGPAPAAPGAAPASGAGGGAAPRPDELAFLKSLTGSPAPADRTPPTRRSEEISRPAPFPSEPLSGAEPRVGGPGARSGAAAPGATSGAGAPNGAGAAAGATGPSGTGGGTGAVGGGAKTLKCGECGTLNRPTEWYCERCGAELAAV